MEWHPIELVEERLWKCSEDSKAFDLVVQSGKLVLWVKYEIGGKCINSPEHD